MTHAGTLIVVMGIRPPAILGTKRTPDYMLYWLPEINGLHSSHVAFKEAERDFNKAKRFRLRELEIYKKSLKKDF